MNDSDHLTQTDKPNAAKMSRFVFKEAFQHPTTIFPASSMLISGLYLSVIDFNRAGFAVLLGSGVLAALSFVWHYFFRFEKIVAKMFKEKKYARFERLEERERDLYKACSRAGFHQGASELRQLSAVFQKLRHYLLEDSGAKDRPQSERFLVIATEAFKEGMTCLELGLRAHQVKRKNNANALRTELVAWTAERKKLNRYPQRNQVKIQAINTKIESHRTRLDRLQKQSDQVAAYLAQAEVIEGALEKTFFEVSNLMTEKMNTFGSDSANQLEKAVAAARKVEEKLRAMEQPDAQTDSVYLEAGRKSDPS